MDESCPPVLGYVERVEVIGHEATVTLDARIDTGAARTCIDTALADELGQPPFTKTRNITTSAGDSETRPIAEFGLVVADRVHSVRASLRDRASLSYRVRLGRDVSAAYLVDPATTRLRGPLLTTVVGDDR
jgi:hypothetical protein